MPPGGIGNDDGQDREPVKVPGVDTLPNVESERMKNMSAGSVMVGLVLCVVGILLAVSPATAKTTKRGSTLVGANSAYLGPLILTAIRLAGSAVFEQSVVVRARRSTNGNVSVTFSRPLSNVIDKSGRKPAKKLVKITFTNKLIVIEAPLPEFRREENIALPPLSEVAEIACAYTMHHGRIESDFEIEVSKGGEIYDVYVTKVPYVPDSYVHVQIRNQDGAMKVERAPM